MVISCCSKRIQFRMGLSLISLNLYKEATNHIDKLLWLHIVVKSVYVSFSFLLLCPLMVGSGKSLLVV